MKIMCALGTLLKCDERNSCMRHSVEEQLKPCTIWQMIGFVPSFSDSEYWDEERKNNRKKYLFECDGNCNALVVLTHRQRSNAYVTFIQAKMHINIRLLTGSISLIFQMKKMPFESDTKRKVKMVKGTLNRIGSIRNRSRG